MILIVVSLFVLFIFSNKDSSFTQKPEPSYSDEEVQIVKMYTSGPNYVFEPSVVKKGIPVRLVADMNKMYGCSRSVVSSSLGIKKVFTESSNTVEFLPEESGEFLIACSMNMYRGFLTVE